MSRSDRKKEIRSLAAKTGKRPRGAANLLNRELARSDVERVTQEREEIHCLAYIERAAQKLFAVRPDSHVFTTSVVSYRVGPDEIGPNGDVANAPKIEVRFVESTPAHWWFDGKVAFLHDELEKGAPARLRTEEGRSRLSELIIEHINRAHPWLGERLSHVSVKDGANGSNLVVDVAIALLDEQEDRFSDCVVALQRLHTIASTEMAKGAIASAGGQKRDTAAVRAAIAAARNGLLRVSEAAEIPRQTALAQRARSYEQTWSRWEESLDRIDMVRSASSFEEGAVAARNHLLASLQAAEVVRRPGVPVRSIAEALSRGMTDDSAAVRAIRMAHRITREDSAAVRAARHAHRLASASLTDELTTSNKQARE